MSGTEFLIVGAAAMLFSAALLALFLIVMTERTVNRQG